MRVKFFDLLETQFNNTTPYRCNRSNCSLIEIRCPMAPRKLNGNKTILILKQFLAYRLEHVPAASLMESVPKDTEHHTNLVRYCRLSLVWDILYGCQSSNFRHLRADSYISCRFRCVLLSKHLLWSHSWKIDKAFKYPPHKRSWLRAMEIYGKESEKESRSFFPGSIRELFLGFASIFPWK